MGLIQSLPKHKYPAEAKLNKKIANISGAEVRVAKSISQLLCLVTERLMEH